MMNNETVAAIYRQDFLCFRLVLAILTTILDVIILIFIKKRNGNRSDLIMITCFTVGSLVTSLGRIMMFSHRVSMTLQPVHYVPAWHCVTYNVYVHINTVGSDSVTLIICLCSFERFLFFHNPNLHKHAFSIFTRFNVLIGVFSVGILNTLICIGIALSHFEKPVLFFCPKAEVASKRYFYIYACTKVGLTTVAAVTYMLTLFVVVCNVKSNQCSLAHFRHKREKSILKSLLCVFTAFVLTQFFPWIAIALMSASKEVYASITVAARVMENSFLLVAALMYLLIHPDLSSQLKYYFYKAKCCRCTVANKVKSDVYIG
ncbi:Pseudouridine-5'-phosphate glycosidase [Trichinella pseudospiralis]